ncbi:MAG: TadE/TadG family type IV pilus assembly protein, partial [Pseudomonadota bacterium]
MRLRRNESGNVAMIAALTMVPLLGVTGIAVDLQIVATSKTRVQATIDTAVLAVTRAMQDGLSDAQAKQVGVDAFQGQLATSLDGSLSCLTPSFLMRSDFPVDEQDGIGEYDVQGSVICSQETTVSKIIGKDTLDFRISSGATWGIAKIDVAFMFDISGSMGPPSTGGVYIESPDVTRLDALKTSAQEAIDILIPPTAPAEQIENTRIAIASYNAMVDAGPYFQQVTGATPTRTYTHTPTGAGAGGEVGVVTAGTQNQFVEFRLYDAGTDQLIGEITDGSVLAVEADRVDNLTVAAYMRPGTFATDLVESMYLDLNNGAITKTENVEPYSLYGDSGGDFFDNGTMALGNQNFQVYAYGSDNLGGTYLGTVDVDFEIVEAAAEEQEITLTSTCVWERDGANAFTDVAPTTGSYLAHQQAWWIDDASYEDGGYWEVGHPNRPGDSAYDGNECADAEPLELTNNRTTLSNYITGLSAGGGTGGHLGVAWS